VKQRKSNYYIIAGTSGTGKTSLLNELNNRQYPTHAEVPREVLQDQVARDGDALPAKNPTLFIEEMLRCSIERYEASLDVTSAVFFDRGIPDLLAYAARFGVDSDMIRRAGETYRYNSTCFLCSPWRAIYTKDAFRGGEFEFYEQFHQALIQGYEHFGYRFIKLPFVSVKSRADFIVEQIPRLNG
jgi:predicted ATPase